VPFSWHEVKVTHIATPALAQQNGLRHGTQFGVPMTEELVTACVEMRVM